MQKVSLTIQKVNERKLNLIHYVRLRLQQKNVTNEMNEIAKAKKLD